MAQTELRLDGLGIRKIVELPPGIKVLSISSNRLRNLGSIVECLTLQEVNLAANKLDEAALAPLAALPALRVLNVSRNHIRDLSPLVLAPALSPNAHAFPALEELNISSNPLGDVTAAMSLQVLRVLTAASLAVTTIQCVHCSLEVIDLRNCCLQSIFGLQALPYLAELIVDGNALLSSKDLVVHSSLQALRLAHNAIGDISAVQLPCLTELDLASNSLSQAINLAGAPRLVSLVLRANQITSLVQLSALRCLTFLDASQNKIRALEPSLRWSLRPLRVLLLNGNEIHDVEDVAKAMEMAGGLALEHLDLRDNPLSSSFYPFADRLPTWTWEARANFASFDKPERDGSSLDLAAFGARERYCNRLTSICPSLQSLDGLLVDGVQPSSHSFQHFQPTSEHRSACPRGQEDEVLYSTPRQSGEMKAEDQPGQNAIDAGAMDQPAEFIAHPDGHRSEAKIATNDAATSPIFRECSHSGTGQMSSLANLGLPSALLAARNQKRQEMPSKVDAALEVALAATAEQDESAEGPAEGDARPQLGMMEKQACERSGLESQNLFVHADAGSAATTALLGEGHGGAYPGQVSYVRDEHRVHGAGPMHSTVSEDLMYKGEEFEVQQLDIVEKLEKAHQELAKQWQELDMERQKSNKEQEKFQEEQRQRIQLFAQEQAEVQAGLKIQLEEVQKRSEWESQQQKFLEEQQQQLEAQWQREQERRKQQWHSEQEAEFSKLQQRFQRLQQQFQERLDSAHRDVDDARTSTTYVQQKRSETRESESFPHESLKQGESFQGQGDADAAIRESPRGCLQFLGFQNRPKTPKESRPRQPQEAQQPFASDGRCSNSSNQPEEPLLSTSRGEEISITVQAKDGQPGTLCTEVSESGRTRTELNKSCPVSVKGPTRAEPKIASSKAGLAIGPQLFEPLASPAELAEPITRLVQDPLGEPAQRMTPNHLRELGVDKASHTQQLKEDTAPRREELPGSNGAFQRALHGRGIWQEESAQHQDRPSLKVTASLDADHRVVLEEERAVLQEDRRMQPHCLRQQVSPTLGFSPKKEQYLRFLQKEIAAQRAFLRDIKSARKDQAGHLHKLREISGRFEPEKGSRPGIHAGPNERSGIPGQKKVHFGSACRGDFGSKELVQRSQSHGPDEPAWHCVVTPVNAGVRGALDALISQQAWSVPGRPQSACLYSLGRAIQNSALPSRQHFDALVSRDAAREGVVSPLGFSQRAFFCDKNSKLSEVIASPFGFGAVYQGMAILVALELRHAERLCWPDTAHLTGRTIVAEIALGRCHTSHALPAEFADLYSKGGAVPLAKGLESEYRRGADSVYFPEMGIVAILSPTRALPVFLAEYSREFVATPCPLASPKLHSQVWKPHVDGVRPKATTMAG